MEMHPHSIYEICAKPDIKMFVFAYVRDSDGNLTTMRRFGKELITFTKEELTSVLEVFDENN